MDEETKPKRKAPEAFIEAGKKHRWQKGTSGNAWRIPPEFAAYKWEPGQSGNPAGKLKGWKSLTKAMQHCGDSVVPGNKDGLTVNQVIAANWASLAMRGNVRAMETWAARLEGLPQSSVSLSGSVELPVGERLVDLAGRLKSLAEEKEVQ